MAISLSIRCSFEHNGVEVLRPNCRLSKQDFETLNSLQTSYHMTWWNTKKYYSIHAENLDLKKLLADKNFEITKSETFDTDYKKIISDLKKNPRKKTATKSTTKTSSSKTSNSSKKTSTPTTAPSNASDDKLDDILKAITEISKRQDEAEKRQNRLEDMFSAFLASQNMAQ